MGFDPEKSLAGVDLTNKTIIVTGSTSGIGFATAQILVQKGAKVYLAARNPDKAAACIKRIEETLSKSSNATKGQALFHQLDLMDPKVAKQSAEAFLEKEERLDILINCAALIMADFKLGVNGVQEVMTVNYFSTSVFTETLLPLLKKTAAEPGSDVRIVNVASDGHSLVPNGIHFKSKDDFNINYGNSFMQTVKRYGVSKLAEILWTGDLQRRLSQEGSNIIVLSLNPGTVYTESAENAGDRFMWPVSSILRFISRLTFLNVIDGAGTSLIAATSPKVRAEADTYKGAYLRPFGKLAKPSKQAQSEELSNELRATTLELLKEWGV